MINKKNLKKQIIYRSSRRGTKEMDILLESFVQSNIHKFNYNELLDLNNLLKFEDIILYNWYFNINNLEKIPSNKITKMFKLYKI